MSFRKPTLYLTKKFVVEDNHLCVKYKINVFVTSDARNNNLKEFKRMISDIDEGIKYSWYTNERVWNSTCEYLSLGTLYEFIEYHANKLYWISNSNDKFCLQNESVDIVKSITADSDYKPNLDENADLNYFYVKICKSVNSFPVYYFAIYDSLHSVFTHTKGIDPVQIMNSSLSKRNIWKGKNTYYYLIPFHKDKDFVIELDKYYPSDEFKCCEC